MIVRPPAGARTPRAAFTLIELLVVVGMIAILVGVIGVGLAGGRQGADVSAAREILRAHLVAARSQAALHQNQAALFIAADPSDAARYLRYVAVVRRNDASSPWHLRQRGAILPGDVRVLPPALGSTLLTDLTTIATLPGQSATFGYIVPFEARGTLADGGAGQLWVGIGTPGTDDVQFAPDSPRVGLTLSRYGAITWIEENGEGSAIP